MNEQRPYEGEAGTKTQIIHLGEEFQLFKPDRTEKYYSGGDVVLLFSDVYLETGILGKLRITIYAEFANTIYKIEAVTPFNPQEGYPLDQDDFSAYSRKLKIEKLEKYLFEEMAGFAFLVGYVDDTPENIFRQDQSEHIYRFLDSLYLVLLFPNGSSFVSRAHYDSRSLSVTFDKFFPSDTGPLAVLEPIKTEKRIFRIEEGLRVVLPDDIEKLESIKGKFLYIP